VRFDERALHLTSADTRRSDPMNLTAMLRAILGANLDAETRQALVRAAQGESGPEIDAALDSLIGAFDLIDANAAVNMARVQALLDDLGLEKEDG
jgi:hypothetical protein